VAGHSKWSNIKRRKGAQDAVRGKLFTKLIKEIMVAAKMGDPDPDNNPRLRLAVDKAKSQSMPRANIERAIAKASGELQGANYERVVYEGYGPAGVAVLVECLTDNRNRSSSEVRHAFTKSGGTMGTSGSVAYMFQRKGLFAIVSDGLEEDDVMMQAIEGGGDDVVLEDGHWIVTCPFESYDSCKKSLLELGKNLERSELTQLPDNDVALSAKDAEKLMRMLERFDDLDDVQETYTNGDMSALDED
jgi:YebC/PmpR family DNA-binding regulatory protein